MLSEFRASLHAQYVSNFVSSDNPPLRVALELGMLPNVAVGQNPPISVFQLFVFSL